ncbi:hypothetical protein [Spiroplasma endosymbiont of Othius punctulatus]|uniref:hypothetical protein n=1 Tax=Spiroplasma endosymbiont of Othius punctulatus TaxID=3066289 RepID=UPI0030CE41F3
MMARNRNGKSTLFIDIITLGISALRRKRRARGRVKKLRYEMKESGKFKNHNKRYEK